MRDTIVMVKAADSTRITPPTPHHTSVTAEQKHETQWWWSMIITAGTGWCFGWTIQWKTADGRRQLGEKRVACFRPWLSGPGDPEKHEQYILRTGLCTLYIKNAQEQACPRSLIPRPKCLATEEKWLLCYIWSFLHQGKRFGEC